MNKRSIFILGLIIICGLAIVLYMVGPGKSLAPTNTSTSPSTNTTSAPQTSSTTVVSSTFASLPDLILVAKPASNETISSPLKVTGAAKGSWFFENSAPIKLVDSSGKTLAEGTIKPDTNAQTDAFVHFTGTLTFTKPATATGVLILMNDNPSGDPDKAKKVQIPVTF